MTGMQVRALSDTWWGGKNLPAGSVIELERAEQFSHLWMEPIGWTPPPPRTYPVIRRSGFRPAQRIDALLFLLEAVVEALPPEAQKTIRAKCKGLPYRFNDKGKGSHMASSVELAASFGYKKPSPEKDAAPAARPSANGSITEDDLEERGRPKLV